MPDPSRDNLHLFCVQAKASIRDTMAVIDKNGRNVAMVVDATGRLVDIVTDGDLRRAILGGGDLDLVVGEALAQKREAPYPRPLSLAEGTPTATILELMDRYAIRYIPLIDEGGVVTGLAIRDRLVSGQIDELRAVIMAGGLGTRLRPLTDDTPKPMLPVAGKPVIAHTVEQLRDAGVKRIVIATHYKPEKIRGYFGDGRDFGVEIGYAHERIPLGTAGALAMIETDGSPILIVNGDILSGIDYRAMLDFHRTSEADLTVAVAAYQMTVPYGVVESNGAAIERVVEKPRYTHLINAGIYLASSRVQALIPQNAPLDMTDLIGRAIAKELRVLQFPVREYWLDIGRIEDYQRAEADLKAGAIARRR
jgi:dTDP-glucose pyrophosphorylase